MSRLLFDFPPRPGAAPVRRVFRDPVKVVRAFAVDEVEPALTRIQRAVLESGLSAAGYLAYEAAPAFDPAFRVRSGGRGPLVWFGLYEGFGEPAPSPRAPSPEVPLESWDLDLPPEDFAERVARIRRAIEAGETYQVNFTTRLTTELGARPLAGRGVGARPGEGPPGGARDTRDTHDTRDLRDTRDTRDTQDTPDVRGIGNGPAVAAASHLLYDRLRRSQGDGYHALLEMDDQIIVSASPELFFQLRGRQVTVRPMKGTRGRGRWLEEDETLARELRSSEKEQAENRMIVDLLRNDLGRVAEIGSVRVPRVFDVERYRTVLQMTSTVTGTLPQATGFVDVLRALFPSGSVTGAPKIQTMKIIAELESSPREVYCGAIGYVEGGSGDALFNVPIRTLRIDRDSGIATYGTGSGITWGSTAEEEYEEIRAKARILSERWPDFDLLESLRLEDGEYGRLERHLTRMRNSARYFDRPFPENAVREALEEVARGRTADPYKVRVTLSERGKVEVTVEDLMAAVTEATPDSPGPVSAETAGSPGPDLDPDSRSSFAAPPALVALADTPVDSTDRFLFHKTTHRTVYDSHRSAHPGMFDVLLWNERGEITEFTRGNVVLEIDGRRLTPRRSSGLLGGCFRAELLEEGIVEEALIVTGDLARAERMWLVNSVRGWVPVTVTGKNGEDDR